METEIVPLTKERISVESRFRARGLSAEEWIDEFGSGTLRKNKRTGFAWKVQYLEERIAFEFGWEFECFPRTRLMFNDPISEQDEHSITEAGWHIDRLKTMYPFDDYFECKYIHLTRPDGSEREGVGVIVRKTSAQWIPSGYMVFAIVAEYNKKKGKWKKAKNPC